MQMPKFRFDGTFTFGNAIQTAVIIGGFVLYYGSTVEWKTTIEAWRDNTNDKLTQIDGKFTSIETSRAINLPRLSNLEASDKIQDERMGNLADAVIEIRKSQSTITEKLAVIGESIAVIKERTEKKEN